MLEAVPKLGTHVLLQQHKGAVEGVPTRICGAVSKTVSAGRMNGGAYASCPSDVSMMAI